MRGAAPRWASRSAGSNPAWNTYRFDSQSFLYPIRRAYDGLSVAQVGARGQTVRVFFRSGGHVDGAPVFLHGDDDYGLPGGDGSWINTAPTLANGWFTRRNADLGYNLAPLVRMVKKWNAAHSRRMRSFHLETVAGSAFSTLGSSRQRALASFFEWAPRWLDVSDPGGQSGVLSGYLSWNARRELVDALESAAGRAQRALESEVAGDHTEAKRLWRIVLGSTFPID